MKQTKMVKIVSVVLIVALVVTTLFSFGASFFNTLF